MKMISRGICEILNTFTSPLMSNINKAMTRTSIKINSKLTDRHLILCNNIQLGCLPTTETM